MNKKKQKGFVLLFAVLLVSIVLTVTLVLLDITLRQLVLSAIGQDSQKAYYAAYAGIDCAIFWDRDNPNSSFKPFGAVVGSSIDSPDGSGVGCGAATSNVDHNSTTHTATFRIKIGGGGCAEVEVQKLINASLPDTLIRSRGYNLGDEGDCPSPSSSRLVERALVTRYNDNW